MNVTDYGERNPATPSQRLTPEQRINLRANLTRLARDAEDAALLIDALEDDRG